MTINSLPEKIQISEQQDKLAGAWKAEAAVIVLSICAFGLFYECFAAPVACACGGLLVWKVCKTGTLQLPGNLMGWILFLLPVVGLITLPFAIDKGMAAMGIVKFLPVSLFVLLVQSEGKENRNKILDILPDAAAIITGLTMLSWFTPLKETFFINGRYSGCFQYANSYAAFLMVCIFLLVFRKPSSRRERYKTTAEAILLMSGIILSGCRAVFFLTIIGMAIGSILSLRKKDKHILPVVFAALGVIALGLVVAVLSGEMYGFARYTQIHLKSSSLMARLLYNIDGVKMLLTHPLGLGAKGFLFYQGSVQTGNYSATYAHNELLQTALDFGIIPAVLAGVGYIKLLVGAKTSQRSRLILLLLGIHVLFDWDFQFPALLMILACLICQDSKKISIDNIRKRLVVSVVGVSVLLSIWMGAASCLEFFQKYEAATNVYPWLTSSQMRVISQSSDSEKKYEAAEQICKQNDYCTIALQCMAEKRAQEGDLDGMVLYAQKAMKSSRYNKEGYEIYIYMLSYAIETANASGDADSTYKYLRAVQGAQEQIRKVEEETSAYAEYLYDKPEIELDEQYTTYLEQASGNLRAGQ